MKIKVVILLATSALLPVYVNASSERHHAQATDHEIAEQRAALAKTPRAKVSARSLRVILTQPLAITAVRLILRPPRQR